MQKAADVACQLNNPSISTFLGVTHHADNPLVVTAMTGAPLMLVQNGSPALDAGPTIVAKRVPPGIVPRPRPIISSRSTRPARSGASRRRSSPSSNGGPPSNPNNGNVIIF